MSLAAGADAALSWRPGGTIAGYRLVTRIAGGMATEVWLAKIMGAEGFEKVIVLKSMRANLVPSPAAGQAFTSEAAVTARLYHRNIIQLIDCGQVDDRYYMVMEFIDGMTLRQMIGRLRERERPVPWTLLAHIGIEICAALQYLHELHVTAGPLGYLHRDLEPENVMITGAGTVKVIDFGAARPAPGGGEGRPFGRKLRYASPEVIQGQAEDRRGDVYSLGTMLYEMITGTPAFDGDSLRIVSRIIEGQPRPARTLVPDLPVALSAVIEKAMARRPADRFATADAMSLGLQAFIDQAPTPTDRGQSVKDVLRSLFDGLSGTFWREALFPALRPPATRSVRPAPPPPPPVESFTVHVQDSSEELGAPVADKTEPGAAAPAPAPPQPQPLAGLFTVPPVAPPPAPDIFPAPARVATAPVTGADAFAVRRRRLAADPVAAWTQGPGAAAAPAPSDGPVPPPPPRERRGADPRSTEAAWCFDRGLAFISERNYVQALVEWRRAVELEPDNRLYQANLKRLRTQIERPSPERTETP